MPLKAKVGAAILAVLRADRDHRADDRARTTRSRSTRPRVSRCRRTCITCSARPSTAATSSRSCSSRSARRSCSECSPATFAAVPVGRASASRAGFLGGAADEGLSLVTNVFLVLPALPLLIIVLGYLPNSGQLPTAIVLSILGWAWGARVIRAQTLTLRGRDYVAAARETGRTDVADRGLRDPAERDQPDRRELRRHGPLRDPHLGRAGVHRRREPRTAGPRRDALLGAEPSAIKIGAWWWYVPPGVAVALLGMSLVLLNFGLDELGNPRLRDDRSRRRDRRPRAWRPTDPTPVMRRRSRRERPRLRRRRASRRPERRQRPSAAGARDPRPLDRLRARRRREGRRTTSTSTLAARRDRRPRRRERLGQVDACARRVPAAAPARGDHRRQRHLPRQPASAPAESSCSSRRRASCASCAGARSRSSSRAR